MSQFGLPCFLENLRLFANPQTEPEKYNLYNGFRSMAEGLASLVPTLHKLEMQLDSMDEKLSKISRQLPPK
jgi:hypothetical protein